MQNKIIFSLFILLSILISCSDSKQQSSLEDFNSGKLNFLDFKKVSYVIRKEIRIQIKEDSLHLERHKIVRSKDDEFHYFIPIDSSEWKIFSDSLSIRQQRRRLIFDDYNYIETAMGVEIDVKDIFWDYLKSGDNKKDN